MFRARDGEKLLFIGDSITQCMRESVAPPLGAGYVQFVNCFLAAKHPAIELDVVNRGVDGDTVRDLEARWQRDVLDERPDWLFVMIGVNDVQYRAHPPYAARAATYRRMLARTRAEHPCRIVLMDPSPLEEFLPAASHAPMRALCRIVREPALEFDAEHIPIFERFYGAVERAPTRGWLIDVPHPNLSGQAVLALAVLEHLGW